MENDDFQQKTDEELVVLALENKDDFAHLINRYKNKLFFYIRRLTNVSEEDIEDLLQDIFLKVYINLNDFDRDLKFSSWIYRIAHNTVIDNHRRLKVRPQTDSYDINDEKILNIAADFDIKKEMDQKILAQNIKEALNKIEEKHREILLLKFLEEKDYNEISDILQIPLGTVASRLNQAKKKFAVAWSADLHGF